jgi:murein DD-endopeptidase MepM/ murein hydrolase activator NlpD
MIDRSLAYTPQDVVRDGLPYFGSVRDDWMGTPRPHKGLDIYVDKVPVQAAAKGIITGVGFGERAGGWAKIDHGNGVETVYVHVSRLTVEAGDDVAKGQRIATVDGAVGNAVEPQLHFELRLDGESVDPVPYIFELASEDLKRKIKLANERLEVLARERASRVRQTLDR